MDAKVRMLSKYTLNKQEVFASYVYYAILILAYTVPKLRKHISFWSFHYLVLLSDAGETTESRERILRQNDKANFTVGQGLSLAHIIN